MANDPYYARKPVPTELIAEEGGTGLAKEEEYANRERKLSRNGKDLRHFWGTKDSYYNRKPVPDVLIKGVGETGLTSEEEYQNRERKLSQDGKNLRHFWGTKDTYYNRKAVPKSLTTGVGETGIPPAEAYEARERKLSMFQLTNDPFNQISGRRESLTGEQSAIGTGRRRSSAVAPDSIPTKHVFQDHDHLERIESVAEPTATSSTLPPGTSTTNNGDTEHAASHTSLVHDQVTGATGLTSGETTVAEWERGLKASA